MSNSNISQKNDNPPQEIHLEGHLGTFELIMSVLALSAPLMTVAAMTPVQLMFGGAQVTITYLFVTAIFVVFSIGFTKMGMVMKNPGGFYSFVTAGLGKRAGLSVAFLATVSYPGVGFVTCTFFGLTMTNLLTNLNGPEIPWWIFSLICIAINTTLAYNKIDLSAKVLSIVMSIEVIITICYDVAAFMRGGPADGGGNALEMPWFADANIGIIILFIVATFIGFEATVIYREEVKNPEKTIPRATILAVILLGVFYAIAAWAMMTMEGAARIEEVAGTNIAGLFDMQMGQLFGKIILDISLIIIMFSSLASNLSCHNVAARYLFSLGVDGVLPRVLGKVHSRHKSPYVSAIVIGVVWAAVTVICAIVNVDPGRFYSKSSGLGTFGVLFIMFIVSIAVFAYFKKNKENAGSVWSTSILPIISIVGLGFSVVFAVMNFPDLIEGTVGLSVALVILIIAILVAGFVYAEILKTKNPEAYQRIGRQQL